MSDAGLTFTAIEQFAAVDEPGAEPLASATAGGVVIPANGTVIVYGDGGAGKTTLAIDLCFALAAGESWLNIIETGRPLRIAIIENEGPRQEFRKKLERKIVATGARLDGRITVLEEPWAEFSFALEQHRVAIAQAIDEHELDLLVVGPIASVGMVGGGTPDEIRAFEQLLANVRGRCQRPFAILLVHHENRAGQISGAWERFPDTLVHIAGQGNGRTRVYWQKVRHASALHQTKTQLLWADGESYTVEAKPEVTEDTMADELIAAVSAAPGASWTELRKSVRGNATQAAKVRDRLINGGDLINTATVEGRFNLWTADDPAAPRSDLRTALERIEEPPPNGSPEPDRSPFSYIGKTVGTERIGETGAEPVEWR